MTSISRPTLFGVIKALHDSWAADTAYDAHEWSPDNPARGHCVVSSLVIQDYFGGDLVRYEVSEGLMNETHYVNQLAGGVIVDSTASQYSEPVTMRKKPIDLEKHDSIRSKRLADADTARRYTLLKQRVENVIQ